jgi:energy-converting hydrogenase B subunit D
LIGLQLVVLLLCAAAATAVVLSRDVLRQAIVNGVYGLVLVALFLVFQAPDVALSVLVAGGVAYPVVLLGAITRVRAEEGKDEEQA